VPRQIIILLSCEEPRKCINLERWLSFYKENLKENEKYIVVLQLSIQDLEREREKSSSPSPPETNCKKAWAPMPPSWTRPIGVV
jgi:hypothetical protein